MLFILFFFSRASLVEPGWFGSVQSVSDFKNRNRTEPNRIRNILWFSNRFNRFFYGSVFSVIFFPVFSVFRFFCSPLCFPTYFPLHYQTSENTFPEFTFPRIHFPKRNYFPANKRGLTTFFFSFQSLHSTICNKGESSGSFKWATNKLLVEEASRWQLY